MNRTATCAALARLLLVPLCAEQADHVRGAPATGATFRPREMKFWLQLDRRRSAALCAAQVTVHSSERMSDEPQRISRMTGQCPNATMELRTIVRREDARLEKDSMYIAADVCFLHRSARADAL